MDRPRRPTLLGPAALASVAGTDDPATREEAAHTSARLLVHGARSADDAEVVERVVRLADEHGLDLLAELWAGAPADSLAGTLWRLYALRQWVHADPAGASVEYRVGRCRAPVLEAVAGVADPPGPEEVVALVDAVLRGMASGDLATTLERAAAFARIVSAGRAEIVEPGGVGSAARLQRTAEQLEHAAARWREGGLR